MPRSVGGSSGAAADAVAHRGLHDTARKAAGHLISDRTQRIFEAVREVIMATGAIAGSNGGRWREVTGAKKLITNVVETGLATPVRLTKINGS